MIYKKDCFKSYLEVWNESTEIGHSNKSMQAPGLTLTRRILYQLSYRPLSDLLPFIMNKSESRQLEICSPFSGFKC